MVTCVSFRIVVILNFRLRWWCVLCIYKFHPYLQTAVEVNERIHILGVLFVPICVCPTIGGPIP